MKIHGLLGDYGGEVREELPDDLGPGCDQRMQGKMSMLTNTARPQTQIVRRRGQQTIDKLIDKLTKRYPRRISGGNFLAATSKYMSKKKHPILRALSLRLVTSEGSSSPWSIASEDEGAFQIRLFRGLV